MSESLLEVQKSAVEGLFVGQIFVPLAHMPVTILSCTSTQLSQAMLVNFLILTKSWQIQFVLGPLPSVTNL